MGVFGLPPSVLPDISPTRGEIDSLYIPLLSINLDACGNDLLPLSANFSDRTELAPHPISLLVGEMSGRTEGGVVGRIGGWVQ
ncbi:cobaltochelatase subunit CobN [Rhizobium sp. PDO1-076]|nr:cobaltochelatase subunit CobN [Rhizobium sp. PDO1-076]